MNTSALDAPDNRRKKGGRQVARPNRPWTQKELASRHAYNAAGVMLTRADMKELGSNLTSEHERFLVRGIRVYRLGMFAWADRLDALNNPDFIGLMTGEALEIKRNLARKEFEECRISHDKLCADYEDQFGYLSNAALSTCNFPILPDAGRKS